MGQILYTVGAIGYDHTFADVTGLFLPAVLRAARLAPVLYVATRTGEAAQAAAAVVGPSGSVIAGDVSPANGARPLWRAWPIHRTAEVHATANE